MRMGHYENKLSIYKQFIEGGGCIHTNGARKWTHVFILSFSIQVPSLHIIHELKKPLIHKKLLSLSNEKVIEHFFIHSMYLNNCIKQDKYKSTVS